MKEITQDAMDKAVTEFGSTPPEELGKLFNVFLNRYLQYYNILGMLYSVEEEGLEDGEFLEEFFLIYRTYELFYEIKIPKFSANQFSESFGKWYAFFEDKESIEMPEEKIEEAMEQVKQYDLCDFVNAIILKPTGGSKLKDEYTIITIYALFYSTIDVLNTIAEKGPAKKKG